MNQVKWTAAGLVSALVLCASAASCDRQPEPAPGAPAGQGAQTPPTAQNDHGDDHAHAGGDDDHAAHDHEHADDDHDHDHGEGDHDHADEHDHAAPGHSHGEPVDLGNQTSGNLEIHAWRAGDVKPGAEISVDAGVTGEPKIAAVRFWIGVEDAAGSMKARASLEGDPPHWHSHVEVPGPLPAGSKLWIEIEKEDGERILVGFALKT